MREIKFSVKPCRGCREFKPPDQATWVLKYSHGGHEKTVGFLTGAQVTDYQRQGRIMVTESSATCPQCAADGLTNGSLEVLKERWRYQEPKWLYRNSGRIIDQYLEFKKLHP
jgi:hypothetical protein